MADFHGRVAARGLGDAEFAQLRHGNRAPLQAVGDDQPIGIFAADRLDQLANHRHVGLRLDLAGSFIRLKLSRSLGMPR